MRAIVFLIALLIAACALAEADYSGAFAAMVAGIIVDRIFAPWRDQ